MKKLILPLFWCFIIFSSSVEPAEEVSGRRGLKEFSEEVKQAQKPVFTDLYTNWCQLCKVIDNKTYDKQNVIDYLGGNFYSINLNSQKIQMLTLAEKLDHFAEKVSSDNNILAHISNPGFSETSPSEQACKHYFDERYLSAILPDYNKKTSILSW